MRPKNRDSLVAAMNTLIAAARNDPKTDLSFDRLAREAGVSRATAYRDADLRKEWRLRVTRHQLDLGVKRQSLSPSERAARKAETIRALKDTIMIMANHIQALSLTVSSLEAKLAAGRPPTPNPQASSGAQRTAADRDKMN